jgi:hypothetical protein
MKPRRSDRDHERQGATLHALGGAIALTMGKAIGDLAPSFYIKRIISVRPGHA